ncbi:hypothetical protein [Pontibacter mangrovi]|uniref:Outer membrane protein beta-barrel domain-containing protein n=1 Tax=Pontibacter mangrovi TaxID=2589816 RepID=A0A501WAF0_9BACT|nr:hypothetical protein [Pontibacter mangrovi]TPE42556.1 hypothetical protein FJM65_17210 [Pontibacter mangrovi]
MKCLLLLFPLAFFTVLSVHGQEPDSSQSLPKVERKLFVGVEANSVSYMLMFNSKTGGSIEPIVTPHIGYKINQRLSVQLGLGYGKDKLDFGGTYYANEEDQQKHVLTFENRKNTTSGWVVPVNFQFTPFNPNRRIQLYATASLVPTYGETDWTFTRKRAEATTVLEQRHGSGFNSFFIGGLLLKYKWGSRLEANAKVNLLYRHLGKFSEYAESKPLSLGIGIDYRL